jgi:hypothetical protein
LDIYALPLRIKPLSTDKGMELVMDQILGVDKKIIEDEKEIHWYKGKDVHWYIIGKQYTMESFFKHQFFLMHHFL